MTKTIIITAVLSALLTTTLLHAGVRKPTPEISEFMKLNIPNSIAYAMRGAVDNSGTVVGLALTCSTQAPF